MNSKSVPSFLTRKVIILFLVLVLNIIFLSNYNKKVDKILSKLKSIQDYIEIGDEKSIESLEDNWSNLILNNNFFIIEPAILAKNLTLIEWNELKWRYDLKEFVWQQKSLTIGTFEEHFEDKLETLKTQYHLEEKFRVLNKLPFSGAQVTGHVFFQSLKKCLHVVIFHKVKHFFWIGKISQNVIPMMNGCNIHFGKDDEIYEPFEVIQIQSVNYPGDIRTFLSQTSTSKYIHCPVQKQAWFKKYNVELKDEHIQASEQAILYMKSLMKTLDMQFWVACGTLLGWYRQCHITPYTTDMDFGTWSKYLNGQSITNQLKNIVNKHNITLLYRFGEAKSNLEYSFFTSIQPREKVDLFFMYSNGTHFLLPIHIPQIKKYSYAVYPYYKLCSIEILGHKLLGPCNPEKIVVTEYGEKWQKPIQTWNYFESPFNVEPLKKFNGSASQIEEF